MLHSRLNHSVIDQGLLSALGLGMNLLLVSQTDPETFGKFVLCQALVFALMSAQSALILTPLNILIPGNEAPVATKLRTDISWVNIHFSLVASLLILLVCFALGFSDMIVLTVTLYAFANLLREFWRNGFFVSDTSTKALKLDASYVVATCIFLGVGYLVTDPLTASLVALGGGNCLALILNISKAEWDSPRMARAYHSYKPALHDSMWAFAGAAQTELQMRAYIFMVEFWRGTPALGNLQASRFLASPIQLISFAWARVARPRMVAALRGKQQEKAMTIMIEGGVLLVGVSLVYALALVVLWPWLESMIFSGRYPNVFFILCLWWAHTSIFSLNVVASTMLQAQRKFRLLTIFGAATSALALLGLLVLLQTGLPTTTILYLLICVEIFELLIQSWFIFGRSQIAGAEQSYDEA